MYKLRFLLSSTGLIVSLLLASTEGDAFYGDPRFANSQAPTRLLHNYWPGSYPSDEFVMTTPAGTALGDVLRAIDAVNKWNDALRGSPNSLNKYVFHFNQNNDPNGNLIIHFVDAATVDQQCGTTNGDGCNDGQVAGMNDVWVDKGLESESLKLLIQHELGHSLWFTDQYSSNYTCVSTYTSVMDCDPITEATDEVDFRNHYKPTLQNPNPTYPDTWAATWSALYQVGEVDVRFAPSNVEWLYYWQRYTDTGARRRATVTRA